MTEVLGHTLRVTDQRDAEGLADDIAVLGECTDKRNIANAAHIVRCVNAHDELLEACREAYAALLHMATQHAALRTHCVCMLCEAVAVVAAAIAKAEGGQP
jgi:hypothetical protein